MPQATIRGIGVIWGDVGVKFNCVERFVGCREVCRVFYEEDSRSIIHLIMEGSLNHGRYIARQ